MAHLRNVHRTFRSCLDLQGYAIKISPRTRFCNTRTVNANLQLALSPERQRPENFSRFDGKQNQRGRRSSGSGADNGLGLGALALSLGVAYCAHSTSKDDELKELFNAVRDNNTVYLERLLSSSVDVNARHPLGWTLLMLASIKGHVETVKVLLKAGANPNLGDEYTASQRVIMKKGLHLFDLMRQREMTFSSALDSNEDFRGFTALHYAVLMNHADIAKILLSNGADPSLTTEEGQTPIMFAPEGHLQELLKEEMTNYVERKKMEELEERRRFPLEQRLKQYIVGQEGAISTVAAATRRKENGWGDDEHPLVFLFLGSSGIGKTELAKRLAAYVHKDKPGTFIRIDMSEYQQEHSNARFIGAPPGYLGYNDGGQLTKALKKCPNAVVLFDEVDKAHPDVLAVLLQVFDEGRLTDGKGETVECKGAIFVMTSNLASDEIAKHGLKLRKEVDNLKANRLKSNEPVEDISDDITISREFKEKVMRPILKKHFKRDEFLGRINEFVYFLPFSRSELLQLVDMELQTWAKKANDKHRIKLEWDKNVLAHLADGYDVHYGARSIKYEVDRCVGNRLAHAHENGFIEPGCSVLLSLAFSEKTQTHEIKLNVRHKGSKEFVDINNIAVSHDKSKGFFRF